MESLEERVVPAHLSNQSPSGPYPNGAILPNVQLQAVYYNDLSTTSTANKLNSTALDKYLAYLASASSGFLAQLTQYQPNTLGQVIGAGTGVTGIKNNITPGGANDINTESGASGTFHGPVVYDSAFQGDVPGGTPSGDILQSMLSSLVDTGGSNFLKLDANGHNETEFVVFVPYGVVVDALGANSINAFLGYHNNFQYTGTNTQYDNQQIYYAAIPYPTANPSFTGGTFLADFNTNSFETTTIVISHEVAETVTDPVPNTSWFDPNVGGEVGDLQAGTYMTIKSPAGDQYAIQDEFSNAANGGAGGPSWPGVNQDMYVNVFENPTDNFSGVVGTMWYTGGHASTLRGTIDWGNGAQSSLSFQNVPGTNWYNLIGNNGYSDALGTQESNTVFINDGFNDVDSNGATADFGQVNNLGTVPIVSGPIYAASSQPSIPTQTEGTAPGSSVALASFYDTKLTADSTAGLQATISWTDNGAHSVTSTSFSVDPSTGIYTVLAPSNLVFTDDQSSYNLSIGITDLFGNSLGAPIMSTVQVIDPPVIATGKGPFTFNASVSTGTITLATFTDPGLPSGTSPNPASYSAVISWGDGSPTVTATLANGGIVFSNGTFSVVGSHTYASGSGTTSSFTINVAISHNGQLPTALMDQVTVNNAVATSLKFSTAPGTSISGTALNGSSGGVVVQVLDQFGNPLSGNYTITMAVASGPGNFTSGSTTSVTVTNSSTATFSNLVLDTAGSYTLTASATLAGNAATITSGSFVVVPNQLSFSTPPPSVVESGGSFGLTVTADDATGGAATHYQGTVTLSIFQETPAETGETGTPTLAGIVSLTSTNGVYQFTNLNLNQAGTYILQATTGPVSSATNVTVQVDANHLVFTTIPTSTVSGANFQVIVQAEDELGNVDGNFTANVTLAIATGPTGSTIKLGGSGTVSVAAVAGVATFNNVTLDKAGTYTLSATSTYAGSITISGTSGNLLVSPSQLNISVQPPSILESGATFGMTVQALNADGSVATTYQGPITLAIDTDTAQYSGEVGTATLGGTVTMNATSGVAVFTNLNLNQLGTYTLQASAGTTTSAASSSIAVVANRLLFTTVPTSVQSSAGFQVIVKAEDELGNVDKNFASNVTLTINSGPAGAQISGGTSVTIGASQGVATFNGVTLDKFGTYTLTATAAPPQGTLSVTSGNIQVTANQLVITLEPPGTVESGATFTLTVKAEDSTGAVDTNFQGPVSLAIATQSHQAGLVGTPTLGGTTSLSNGNGVYSFTNLNLNQLGSYTLQASGGGLTQVSSQINVVANQLVYTVVPTSVNSGANFQVIVKAEDELGNVDTNFGSSVSLSIATGPSGAQLQQSGSSPVSVTAQSGIATFNNLTLDLIGTYTLTATANPPQGTLTKTSSSITVNAILAFATGAPPSSVTSGSTFTAQVGEYEVINGHQVAVNNVSGTVTLSVASGPGGIRGTTTASFVGGVATFNNLILDHFGNYTLSAALSGGGSVTSNTIAVTASAFKLISSSKVPSGQFTTVQFAAVDDEGNTCTNFNNTPTVTLQSKPFRGAVMGSMTPTVSNGIISLSLDFLSPGTYTLLVSWGNISGTGSVTVPGSITGP